VAVKIGKSRQFPLGEDTRSTRLYDDRLAAGRCIRRASIDDMCLLCKTKGSESRKVKLDLKEELKVHPCEVVQREKGATDESATRCGNNIPPRGSNTTLLQARRKPGSIHAIPIVQETHLLTSL
jgi:hypothetical protein